MGTTLPAFDQVEASLYLTLCGRALDNRSPRPLLADSAADELVKTIGYDCAGQHLASNQVRDIALRSKRLDEVVARFIARHPDAVVLDLGAGLDTRFSRIEPPSTVDWYDVDLPRVIAARTEFLPARANVHPIAADLTVPEWLADIPGDRPAIAVCDGLVAFLSQETFVSLLNRVTGHFPCGELAFNAYTRFHLWAIKHYRGTNSIADVALNPGFDDPHAPEQWAPKLKLVEEIFITRAPEIAQYPLVARLFTRLAAHSAAWSRRGTAVLHYRF